MDERMLHPNDKVANRRLHEYTHGGFEFILVAGTNISHSNDIDFDAQVGGLSKVKGNRGAIG